MTDSYATANRRLGVFLGLESGVADWDAGPTLAEFAAFTNVSGAVNWDSYDFGLKASDSVEDRTLADAAGAKSRGPENFGGAIEFVTPKPGDTSSIFYVASQILAGDRTKLALITRGLTLQSAVPAAGDVVNAYHVLADSHETVRATENKPSYAEKVAFLAQDDVIVNHIIPSTVPTKVALTPTPTATCDIDGTIYFRAVYEGVNVTVGAQYVSSDPTVLLVTPHGIGIGLKAGTASVTASVPGSATGTATVVTVQAP